MASDYYTKEWSCFLMCKECKEYKDTAIDFYKHNQWFLWVLWRCKECIKRWRKTEHELNMARKRDRDRYYNNEKRRKFIFTSALNRRKVKWYWTIHSRTDYKIKELWIRPKFCPICNNGGRIIAHHEDYEKRNEIVFCCQICHDKIHKWKIKEFEIVDLLRPF